MYNILPFIKYVERNEDGSWDKLRDDAPEEAVKAFEKYKKDLEKDLEEDIFS